MDMSSVAVDRWLTKSITDDDTGSHVLEIIYLRINDVGPCFLSKLLEQPPTNFLNGATAAARLCYLDAGMLGATGSITVANNFRLGI